MKKGIFILFFSFITVFAFAQPANDNCASAVNLTIDAALSCAQTTQNATLQGGECITNYAGVTEYTSWYRFTANNDSLVLNFIQTNVTNCAPEISVYGPFAPGGGCIPGCASTLYNALLNGDPGSHILLTGLATSGNNSYLIQIQNNDCGGGNSRFVNFCINMQQPEGNNTAGTADLLNACGTAFTNSTNGGYWQTGTSTGFNNLDGNGTTTCGTCGEAGDDTPFIINNVSWTYFCSLTAGTWQITVNGVSGCTLAAPNQGVQASVFTGTPGALSNQGNSQNPIPPGGSWTSGVLTVNSGQCAYLMIDGFAGDACNYNVTLTNLTGGCIVLPIEMGEFYAETKGNAVVLNWSTYTEKNNNYFIIERSFDNQSYEPIGAVKGAGHSQSLIRYSFTDVDPEEGLLYYRLKQVDNDGKVTVSGILSITFSFSDHFSVSVFPNPSDESERVSVLITGDAGENIAAEIRDVAGNVLQVKTITIGETGEVIYHPRELNRGIYFIRCQGETGQPVTQKFIIK